MIAEALFNYIYDSRFVYQSLATLAIYYGVKIVHFYSRRKKRFNLFKAYGIPGPEQSLIDGSLGMMGRKYKDRRYYLEQEEWLKKYGKIYGYFIGDEPSVVITDLEVIRAIFMADNNCFNERCKILVDGPLTDGILFVRFSRWKYMRKVLAPSFTKYNMRGGQSSQFIEDSIKLMLDYIDIKLEETRSKGSETFIDMHDLMKSTSLNLISEIALKLPNIQVHEKDNTVLQLDNYLAQADQGAVLLLMRMPFLLPIVQFIVDHYEQNTALRLINKTLDAKIDEGLQKLANNTSEQTNEQPQVIDTLIKLHYEHKLSRREVIGIAYTLLFAGYDTTSTTLSYVFWALAKHQDCQDKLRAELTTHGIESKYLTMVINETLRMYPNVLSFTTRLATATFHTNGITIPQGARVMYHNWLMHRNPKLWPNPEIYDPERFKGGAKVHPCAFAPFGLGDRKCLGYQLAYLEMKMIICDIILRYKLHLVAPENLQICVYAAHLSKPTEKIVLKLEKLVTNPN